MKKIILVYTMFKLSFLDTIILSTSKLFGKSRNFALWHIYFGVCCFCFTSIYGQGWEKNYQVGTLKDGYSFIQTSDSGYLIVGTLTSVDPIYYNGYALKLNNSGDVEWTKYYDSLTIGLTDPVCETNDGGYMLVGHDQSSQSCTPCCNHQMMMMKITSSGEEVWRQTHGCGNSCSGNGTGEAILNTSDGGYIYAGTSCHTTNGEILVVKTDLLGNNQWESRLGANDNWAVSIRHSFDGGYVVLGVDFKASVNKINILKIDGNGGLLWSKSYGGTGWSRSFYMELTSDSGYVITGWTNSYDTNFQAFLLKVDANGDSVFMKTYVGQFVNPNDQDLGYGVKETKDKGFIVTGFTSYLGNTGRAVLLFKTDKYGNMEWSKSYGGVLSAEEGMQVMQTIDGGFLILGDAEKVKTNELDLYLIKTDSLGNIHTNLIAGNVFQDFNSNCINDSSETNLFHWPILVEPGSMLTYTDSNGNYSIEVDTGTYIVSSINPSSYWGQNCPNNPDSYTIPFTSFYDTAKNIIFSKIIDIECPQLTIDITAPRLRICARNTYSVMYCNQGTATVSNAYIEVTFDESIIPISSTIPWINIVGDVYTFDIGSVNPNECNTFFITDSISCDVALGTRICVKAQIFPDSICGNTDSTWDRSSIRVEGNCINDSIIKLVIKNTGETINGDMDTTSEYRIYINN